MPRTAPDVTTAATFKTVSLRYVDSSGDLRTTSLRVPGDSTPAEVEALVVAAAAITNGNIYEVQITDRWAALADAGSASDDVHVSVYDNIALNMKDIAAGVQQTAYIPAPIAALIPSGDAVDTANVPYQTWRDAVDTLLNGNYAPITVRFTERREKNDSTPA